MADVSVRPARPADAGLIAGVQLRTWRAAYAEIVPGSVLGQVTEADAERVWTSSLAEPPTERHRVLVALGGAVVVGFAAVAPAELDEGLDPALDIELQSLLVDPADQRRGHGSRLLAAVMDTAPDAGVAVSWPFEADTVSRDFLRSAGWREDGARRDLDMAGTLVPQVRLHTALRG